MFIHIVVLAWLYVVLMMAVAEGMSTQGSVLGAIFTFLLYGALPIALVVYVMATPARKRARKVREAAEEATEKEAARAAAPAAARAPAMPTADSGAPDQRREAATGSAVAPEREKP
ncbi:MAG: hypothetical protein EOO29_00985 [Comamonadaceae bacterium]|nr:MAG: hypothetical protein EOO29_00985 [Comamonadaceae bacterium]